MNLTIRPLTPDLWPKLEELFGPVGACNGCWCMYWRIGSAYTKRPRGENKKAFKAVVKKGPPPGLVAFADDLAVGWAQVTPRAALPRLDRGRFQTGRQYCRCGHCPAFARAGAAKARPIC
jgi:hypothetical protein